MPKWMLREVYAIRDMFPERYNVTTLRNIIRAKLRVSEASEFMSGTLDSPRKPKEAQKKAPKAALFTTAAIKRHEPPKCYLCNQKHWVTDCFTFPDVESRRARAKKLGLCMKCLGKGHAKAQCPRKKPCFYCQGQDHHGALCEGVSERPANVSVVPEQHAGHSSYPSKKGKKKVLTATVAKHAEEVVPTCLTCAAHAKPPSNSPKKLLMTLQARSEAFFDKEP
ncbi:Zinc knuckle family protein [Aphelenchoides avenae]|nr:Zinc knuckle family protein [Aphelenchus avenae]